MKPSDKKIYVAIMGFGNIGRGVAELLKTNAKTITDNSGVEVVLKYILDVRFPAESEFEPLFVTDFSVIEHDADVSVVVETIGDTKFAYNFTKLALRSGKSVVTSNKELVALHGFELFALAQENNVKYLVEASVGGGIPIIHPLRHCLAANKITEIYGILNGTCNYILTEMTNNGTDYATALKAAQALGYAEPNPDADVSGKDTFRKICVLSMLAFGKQIDPNSVRIKGIQDVNIPPKGKIKLIGRAVLKDDGDVEVSVAPQVLDDSELLANVNGVFNAVVFRCDALGDVVFYGKGAGKMPTASAVVADILECGGGAANGKC